jgi:predicted kinase
VVSFAYEAPDVPLNVRQKAHQSARAYYLHALASQHPRLERPVLVAVGGLIASGKSTTARRLAALLNCATVGTDWTRKQLLQQDELSPLHSAAFDGAYDEAFSEKVYDEVFRRAGVVLQSGRSVVIDASFRSPEARERILTLAQRCGVSAYFVHCRVPREVALARLEERAKSAHVSDGRVEIYDAFAQSSQPPTGTEAHHFTELDTTLADAQVDQRLQAFLGVDTKR